MAKSLNKVELIGRLGRDAELKFTPNGTAVTKFSVATSNRFKDKATGEWKENTNWTNCVQWSADKLAPYLIKGVQVYVEGRLESRSYDDKEGKKVYVTEVVVNDVILLGDGNASATTANTGSDESDSLPF